MKIFKGKVISKNMEKTATVEIVRLVAHPVYKKRYKRIKKYQVHDELGVEVGQEVRFVASRPYSKSKRWRVLEVVGVPKKREAKGKKVRPERKKS